MITDIEQAQIVAARSWLDTTEVHLRADRRADAARTIRHLMRDLLTLADAVDAQGEHDRAKART